MNTIKTLALPATLAYAGVRGSALLGATSPLTQILAGVGGAMLGLAIAKHI